MEIIIQLDGTYNKPTKSWLSLVYHTRIRHSAIRTCCAHLKKCEWHEQTKFNGHGRRQVEHAPVRAVISGSLPVFVDLMLHDKGAVRGDSGELSGRIPQDNVPPAPAGNHSAHNSYDFFLSVQLVIWENMKTNLKRKYSKDKRKTTKLVTMPNLSLLDKST
jgi:hypothetical protein